MDLDDWKNRRYACPYPIMGGYPSPIMGGYPYLIMGFNLPQNSFIGPVPSMGV